MYYFKSSVETAGFQPRSLRNTYTFYQARAVCMACGEAIAASGESVMQCSACGLDTHERCETKDNDGTCYACQAMGDAISEQMTTLRNQEVRKTCAR